MGIQVKGKNVQASRTGGVQVRGEKKVGNVNVTANSKHGARVSTRLGKGFTGWYSNGNYGFRGRNHLGGGTFLNTSKSGFSVSQALPWGVYNITNPLRSSFNYFGITVRGQQAEHLHNWMFAWVWMKLVYGWGAAVGIPLALVFHVLTFGAFDWPMAYVGWYGQTISYLFGRHEFGAIDFIVLPITLITSPMVALVQYWT